MNYIKITATVNGNTVKLFFKEKDCYSVLQSIKDFHLSLPYSDPSHLYVKIRRVRIADDKARKTRSWYKTGPSVKLAAIVEDSFAKLNDLKESYKKAA